MLKKLHILKKSGKRKEKLIEMADQYHEAVVFLIGHKNKIAFVLILTFIQRCSVFFMTWLIYKGMGLTGESVLSIMILQASVYIAVDMLPLPGAQGITEIMYKASFGQVFKGALLPASMCLTRRSEFLFSADRQCCYRHVLSFQRPQKRPERILAKRRSQILEAFSDRKRQKNPVC